MTRLIISNSNILVFYILKIGETKLDGSFPLDQYVINGYSKPYRIDRTQQEERVIIYVREDIPSKELKLLDMPENIESIFIEINLFKTYKLVFWVLSLSKSTRSILF